MPERHLRRGVRQAPSQEEAETHRQRKDFQVTRLRHHGGVLCRLVPCLGGLVPWRTHKDAATDGRFYIILKPDERLNEAGLLTVRFSIRCEGDWSYTHIDHGTKELQFSIDESDILLVFRYKPDWTPDRWIEHKGEPKHVSTM